MLTLRSLAILVALLAFTFVAPVAAQAAAAPSAKRCKAVKAKKRKTKRDRATLAKCRRQAAKRATTKKPAPAAPPVATPPAAPPVTATGPVAVAPVATPTPTATPAPELPAIPIGTGRAVQVRGFEFGFSLSRPQVLAGTVRVEFNLIGAEDPHTLILYRADGAGATYGFAEQGSGIVSAKSLSLSAGRWRLVCDLPGHAEAGMQVDLEVR